jgi:CheY-like chemotaxis protein
MSTQKALLVDDSKSARFFLRNLLNKNGVEVDMVDSGEAALEYLKEHRPHLIFMDHLMPGIDGFETTKAIKENPETREVPVVMCTSNEGDEYVEQAKRIGAVDILPKPPTENKLHQILTGLNSESPAPAADKQAPTPALSEAEIAEIARHAADASVRDSVESLVEQLLADRLAELRQELQQRTEAQVRTFVAEALEQRKEQVREEARAAARRETETMAGSVVQEAASAILESGRDALHRSVQEAAAQRIESWREQWRADREAFLSLAEDKANTAARAAASALRSANDDAIRSTRTAAEKAAAQAAKLAHSEIRAAAEKDLTQAKWYAGVAALVGILAAVAAYLLG